MPSTVPPPQPLGRNKSEERGTGRVSWTRPVLSHYVNPKQEKQTERRKARERKRERHTGGRGEGGRKRRACVPTCSAGCAVAQPANAACAEPLSRSAWTRGVRGRTQGRAGGIRAPAGSSGSPVETERDVSARKVTAVGTEKKPGSGMARVLTGLYVVLPKNSNERKSETVTVTWPLMQSLVMRPVCSQHGTGVQLASNQQRPLVPVSDTEAERNALKEHVYPKLRDFCRENYGIEFQVMW
ncbi:hypothetical protein Z043_105635 [Scleropages formosus]|uniref:Uncharacterized protein n=1 Tax=Scleropages formosus TaxID=113540 RepID=A0A0P7Z3I8_SCLFO|nr:hypothetical protein Z043_105635 [Scleropages formosus]